MTCLVNRLLCQAPRLSLVQPQVACISTSSAVRTRMKFTYQQGYAWMTAVKKHQRRAANPWVPREMPIRIALDNKTSATFKEAQPELIVPDLTNFYLKPYVDWTAPLPEEPALTSERLFELTYGAEAQRRVTKGEMRPEQIVAIVDEAKYN